MYKSSGETTDPYEVYRVEPWSISRYVFDDIGKINDRNLVTIERFSNKGTLERATVNYDVEEYEQSCFLVFHTM